MFFAAGELTLKQLFEGMVACEKKAAEFYDSLSNRFAAHEKISAFWMRMRDDEFNHASILQTLQGRLTLEQLSDPVEESVLQKLVAVSQLLDEGTEFPPATLGDAYELAHRVETSEVNTIFTFLAFDAVPPEQRKHLVKQQVEEHVESLQDFGGKYKSTFSLRAIPSKEMRRRDG